ncbi:hypothetical protein STENM36S_01747 [Streptomyces tendae]
MRVGDQPERACEPHGPGPLAGVEEERRGPRRVQAGHAVARSDAVERDRVRGAARRQGVRPQVGHRPLAAVGAVGEDRPDDREDHVDGGPEQADDEEGAHEVVAREPALDRHVTQLVQPDEGGGQGQLAVDEVEDVVTHRLGGLDEPADQPRGVAQRLVGGGHVRVEHRLACLRRDEQPGVARLVPGHQEQPEADTLEQQGTLTAPAPRHGDDRAAQDHPQRAVAEVHVGADRPAHQQEDEVDADRGTGRDQALPPGQDHHRQGEAGVQQRPRVGREDHFSRLLGDRAPHAVVARGEFQDDEETEGHHTRRGPQHGPRPARRGERGAEVASPGYSFLGGFHLFGPFARGRTNRSLVRIVTSSNMLTAPLDRPPGRRQAVCWYAG